MMMSSEIDKQSPKPFVLLSGRVVVIACIVCPIIMCVITFPLFLGLHKGAMDSLRGYPQIPTISGTGQFSPERLIFTYGLHLEGVLLAILFMLVYVKFRNKIARMTDRAMSQAHWSEPSVHESLNREEDPGNLTFWKAVNYLFCFWRTSEQEKARDFHYLTFWNNTLTILGLTAAFLLTAVGTVSVSVEANVHTGLAVVMFVCAILHMIFLYFTLARILDVTECDVLLHRICLVMTIPFNVLLIVLTAVLWVACPEGPCVQAAVDLIVVIEYATALFILLYIFRFFNIVQTMSLACCDSGPVVTDRVVEHDFESQGTKEEPGQDRNNSEFKVQNMADRTQEHKQGQEGRYFGQPNPYTPPAHSLAQAPDPQVGRAPHKPHKPHKSTKPSSQSKAQRGQDTNKNMEKEKERTGAVYGAVNYGVGSGRSGDSEGNGNKVDADVEAGQGKC